MIIQLKRILYFFIAVLFCFSCGTKSEEKAVVGATTDTVPKNEDLYNEDGEKIIKPISLTEETFVAIYKGKTKLHFKGYNDVDEMKETFRDGKDTVVHFERAHDIYIRNFSKVGFDFVLDTYTTPSPCQIEGKATFSDYDYATYDDSAGCILLFEFYNDTLELGTIGGCHEKYCGAFAGLGDIYVLREIGNFSE